MHYQWRGLSGFSGTLTPILSCTTGICRIDYIPEEDSLSVVSSIYDPMGFLHPFTVRGRLLVQQLARDKVGWDEPISVEHQQDRTGKLGERSY